MSIYSTELNEIKNINDLYNLKDLAIGTATNYDFSQIPYESLPNLQMLYLEGETNRIDVNDIKKIPINFSNNNNLEYLALYDVPLNSIDLSNNASLEYLSLSGLLRSC